MPIMKVTYDVSLSVDRYYKYREDEEPGDVYDMLFDNQYTDGVFMGDDSHALESVEREFEAIPHSYDVEVSMSRRDWEAYSSDDVDDAVRWDSLVDDENIRAFRIGRASDKARDDLETLLVNGDLDEIIRIAMLLKSMRQ